MSDQAIRFGIEKVDYRFPSDEKSWPTLRIVNDNYEAYSFITHKLGARLFPIRVGSKWVYAWDDKEVVFEVSPIEERGEILRCIHRRIHT